MAEAEVQSADRVNADDGTNGVDVVIDRGGGDTVTSQHFSDVGDDSLPLPSDFVNESEAAGTGNSKVAGYVDPFTEKKAAAGGKRIYSRKEKGVVAAELHLEPDGSATLEIFTGMPLTLRSAGPIIIDSPDVRVGKNAGRPIACVGDFVACVVPQLICAAPGSPAVPVPPTAIVPGGYAASGQIISGATASKAG